MRRIAVLLLATACAGLCNGCAYLARASETPQGVSPAGEARNPDLTGDGRYVAFDSDAPLVPTDTGSFADVFVRDNQTASVARVSVASNGTAGNNASFDPSISSSGRYVAFASSASNLVPGDANGTTDVFVHDRDTDADGIFDEPGAVRTTAVSTAGSATGDGASTSPSITEFGTEVLVAFESLASNFAVSPPDTNGFSDIYWAMLDPTTGEQSLIFLVSFNRVQGELANGPSRQPDIMRTSQLLSVAYVTSATNVTPLYGDSNGHDDVVVWFCFALGCDGRRATYLAPSPNDDQFAPRLAPDTTSVVYASRATNLAPGDPTTGGQIDIFSSDYIIGGTVAITRTAAGFEPNGSSSDPSPSADGSRIAFESDATNLVAGDTNGLTDVFVHAAPGFVQRVSTAVLLGQANGASRMPAMSDDGVAVAFASLAGNLKTPDTNPNADVFVRAAVVPEIDSVFALDANGREVRPVLHPGRNELVVHGRGFGPSVTAFLGDGVNLSVSSVAPAEVHIDVIVIEPVPGPRDLSLANLGTGMGTNRGSLRNCTGCVEIAAA